MSRRKKKLDNRTLPLPLEKIDPKNLLAHLITEAIRKSKLSIEEIADGIARLTGRKITSHMLSNYKKENEHKEPYNIPAFILADFCAVSGDEEPLRYLVKRLGYEMVDKEMLRLARLGQMYVAEKERKREEQALLWLMEKDGAK